LRFFDQPIPDTRFGDNQSGSRRIGLELFAEMGDVNPQAVRLFDGIWPPYFGKDLAMGQNFSRVLDEKAEQRVFCGRQPHFPPVEPHQARRQVRFEMPGAKQADLRAGLRVALRDAKTGQQLTGAEGFGKVIISPIVQRGDLGNANPAAIRAVTEALKDDDDIVRLHATNALGLIDPEAAAKAGVKPWPP
jgi:hypothetical protein